MRHSSDSLHRQELWGTGYALLAAAGFATVSTLTILVGRTAVEGAPIALATIQFWRFAVSALILLLVLWPTKKLHVRGAQFWRLTLAGMLQAVVIYLALSSLRFITAATLAFLFYTYPAWVAVLQAVRRVEPLTIRSVVALVLALAGIGILVGLPGVSGMDLRGVILALCSAMLYAIYVPLLRYLQGGLAAATATAYTKVGGAAVFLGIALARHEFHVILPTEAWLPLGALALFSTVLPSVAFLLALGLLGAVRTTIVATVEPFLTALLGVAVLGQPLSSGLLAGGLLVVGAVLILQTRRRMS